MLFRLETSIPTAFMFIKMSLLNKDCNWSVPVLLIAHSIYCGVTRTHRGGRLNLHKTNAANEELVIRLSYGREVQGGFRYTDCSYHSNSLSNKMDNSLLAVRDINHKSIVVGGKNGLLYKIHSG